jgi:HAD superfamily hydrolase (TIGR01484 family)
MSNVKLVVTDIDGTLVRELTDNSTPVVHEAMQAVQAENVHVVAATARSYEMAYDLFVKLGFSGPSVFDGGASVRDVVTGELLWQNWLDVDRLRAVLATVIPHATAINAFAGINNKAVADIRITDITESAAYVWCLLRKDMLPDVIEQLEKIGSLNLHLMNDTLGGLDYVSVQITDKGSDKFHGVEALRKLLHVAKEQTLVIGDGSNDIPLFKAAGVKVAMGNAVPELKALADYEVSTVEEDGWAEAMRLFVLG